MEKDAIDTHYSQWTVEYVIHNHRSSHCHHYRLYLSALNGWIWVTPNTFHEHVYIQSPLEGDKQKPTHAL